MSSQAGFIDKEIRVYHLVRGCLLLAGLAALACTAASVTDGDTASTTNQTAALAGIRAGNVHRPPQAAFDACAGLTAGAAHEPSPQALERELDRLERTLGESGTTSRRH